MVISETDMLSLSTLENGFIKYFIFIFRFGTRDDRLWFITQWILALVQELVGDLVCLFLSLFQVVIDVVQELEAYPKESITLTRLK